MKDNEKMKRSQQMAMPYLISCKSYTEAAAQIGVSVTQIYEWLKEPEFKMELDKQRNEVVDHAICTLKLNTTKAAETLVELLQCENNSIRRGVANDILDHVMSFIELKELEARIKLLEDKNHEN
jgi:hypothetical protein